MKHFETAAGSPVLLEEERALPIVDLLVVWRLGAVEDPEGQEGLVRMLARLLRRGSRGAAEGAVDERVARLGGRLGISIGRTAVRIHGTVLSRNLAPFVELLGQLLREPALRHRDLKREQRRVRAELEGLWDQDEVLASRQLRRSIFGDHPVATPVGGTLASLPRIRRADLVATHEKALVGRRLLFGAAGDVDQTTLAPLLERAFGDLRKGRKAEPRIPAPKLPEGRRVVLVNKGDRSQTQLAIGTLGSRMRDPDLSAMVVADVAFGGLFTSRLMQAVREERGWSYSAYSHLGAAKHRELWAMWTHPSVANARDCAELQMDLMAEWTAGGLGAKEIRFAKRYLVGSRCLDEDTAARRLDLALDAVEMGFPMERPLGFRRRVRAVKRADANAAVKRRLDPRHLTIVAVGDASALAPRFETLPGVTDVQVVEPRALL